MAGKLGTNSYIRNSDLIAAARKAKGGVSGGKNAKRRKGKGK